MNEDDEFAKLAREELRDAQKDLHLFKKLIEHPAWKRLAAMAERHILVREKEIVYNKNEIRDEDVLRGVCTGISLFRRMPDLMVELAREEIESYKEPEDAED